MIDQNQKQFEDEDSERIINYGHMSLMALSALNCFYKADINFPLFLFAILVLKKHKDGQLLRIYTLELLTCFIDLIWILLALKHGKLIPVDETTEYYLSNISIVLSSIILILKMVVIAFITYKSPAIKQFLTIDGISEALFGLFSTEEEIKHQE